MPQCGLLGNIGWRFRQAAATVYVHHRRGRLPQKSLRFGNSSHDLATIGDRVLMDSHKIRVNGQRLGIQSQPFHLWVAQF
jgi:hypothetical protein